MTSAQIDLLEELVIAPLKEFNCRVFIFGSRAKGTHHPHSDVDLLYKASEEKPLPRGLLSKIREDIEESRFPFIVDLVNEDELAQSYRDRVLQEKIEI